MKERINLETGKVSLLAIAPCLLAIVVDSLGFGLVYPVMTLLFANLHSGMLAADASLAIRNFYLGLGYLLYPFCMFFGASTLGDLSDRWGRKRVLLICIGGLMLSFGLMGLGAQVKSILLLMLGRAFSGLMAGSQPIAQASVMDLSTAETKALNMSLLTLATTVGIVIGPLLGGVTSDSNLVSWFDYATPFWLAAILSFLTYVWIWLGFKDARQLLARAPFKFSRIFTLFFSALKNINMAWLAVIFLLMQIGFGIYFQFSLVLLHQEYQYSNAMLGIFNAFIGLSFAVGMTIIIRLMLKIMNVKLIAITGFLIIAICEMLTAFMHQVSWIWCLAFPLAAFDMVVYTAMLTNFSNAVDQNEQGLAMGVSGSVMSIAWVITGFASNMLNVINVRELIFLGGLSMLGSFILMAVFCLRAK